MDEKKCATCQVALNYDNTCTCNEELCKEHCECNEDCNCGCKAEDEEEIE